MAPGAAVSSVSAAWIRFSCSSSGRTSHRYVTAGIAGGFENGAAVKHGQVHIHPRAQALEHRRKMPRIDAVAVDGGVPPDCLQPRRAVEDRRRQDVSGKRLIEPGNGCRGACQRTEGRVLTKRTAAPLMRSGMMISTPPICQKNE